MEHRKSWADCLVNFFSGSLLAFGIYHIHDTADITEGGVLGMTLLLEQWLRISPAVSGLVLNCSCYLFGWRAMGRGFLLRSAFAAAGFSAGYWLWEQFPPLMPQIALCPLAAALIGALFVGVGCGMCVRYGGAPCGDDALAMGVSKVAKIPIQWAYLVSDLAVLLLSVSYIPFGKILWSLVTVILSGQIIGFLQRFPKNRKIAAE